MTYLDHHATTPQESTFLRGNPLTPSRHAEPRGSAIGKQRPRRDEMDRKEARRPKGRHSKRSAVRSWCAHLWEAMKRLGEQALDPALLVMACSFLLGSVGAFAPVLAGIGHDMSRAQACLGVVFMLAIGYVLWRPAAVRSRTMLNGAMTWLAVFVAAAIATRGHIDPTTITLAVVVGFAAAPALWRAHRLQQAAKEEELAGEAKGETPEARSLPSEALDS